MRAFVLVALLTFGCGGRPAEDPSRQQNVVPGEVVVTRNVTYGAETRGRLRVRVTGAAVTLPSDLAIARGVVTEETLHDDEVGLTNALFDEGHLEATALHKTEVKPDEILVTFMLAPGAVYHVRAVSVTDAAGPVTGWVAPLKTGDVFNRAALVKALGEMKVAYHDLGYANVEADPHSELDREKHEVSLAIAIVRNEVMFLERVEIVGNKSIPADALRAKLIVRDGDRYSETALVKSKTALLAAGGIDRVDFAVLTGSDKTRVVVRFDVHESGK